MLQKPGTNIQYFPGKSRKKPWTEEDDELLKRLVKEGRSLVGMARDMGRAKVTILKHKLRLGLERPKPVTCDTVERAPRPTIAELPTYKPNYLTPTRPGSLDFLKIESKRR